MTLLEYQKIPFTKENIDKLKTLVDIDQDGLISELDFLTFLKNNNLQSEKIYTQLFEKLEKDERDA